MEITLNTPLTDFPGVGEVRAKKLEKLGLVRCADLISYFPRDYEDRRQVYSIRSAPLGQKVCISAMAAEHTLNPIIRTSNRHNSFFMWDTSIHYSPSYSNSHRLSRVRVTVDKSLSHNSYYNSLIVLNQGENALYEHFLCISWRLPRFWTKK